MGFILVLALMPALATIAVAQSSPFNPCPIRCSMAGHEPSAWTHLHGTPALKRCNQTVLFDTSIHMPIDAPDTHVTFRACTASEADTQQPIAYDPVPFAFDEPGAPGHSGKRRRDGSSSSGVEGCLAGASTYRNTTKAVFQRWGLNDGSTAAGGDMILSATTELESWLASEDDCGSSIMLALAGDAVVGLYVGAEIHKPSVTGLMQMFADSVRQHPGAERSALEVCQDQTPKTWSFGIFADSRGNISSVQDALHGWSEARCLSGGDDRQVREKVDLDMVRATDVPVVLGLTSGFEQEGEPQVLKRDLGPGDGINRLNPRADCRAIQVVAGDGCWSLAQRCGISQTNLETYNSGVASFCSSLKPGQYVCCSSGTLPDLSPKPNPDGSCASYSIVKDDNCFDIAAKYSLTTDKIGELNKNTWGWAGCSAIQPGQKICLSTGSPPMPAAVPGALCGPQKEGTPPPASGTALKDLNPCPLNVCCNIWGQCGTTEDFCIESPADTGAPGTSQPGKHGCISNCGMGITNNAVPPASFARVAYFEAWNGNRPCLHMDVTDIDTAKFTHIHFAFGDITPDFQIDVSKVQAQFDLMKSMTGIKRIISFGGWAFSTEAPTYNIFRTGVTAQNRAVLATNVYNFVMEHGLDGVDFDWEYPAAPDDLGSGVPPSTIQEGLDYLEFLRAVKRRLRTKSVSIAAPASYWYLMGYPIKDIGAVVDYVIYMTYDLHGQWDYGNKWSSSGCVEGNCLRSHVNLTETTNALGMITRAGIAANKVFVGVASYGRSFKMAQRGCVGVMCRFLGAGPEGKTSLAAKGFCTDTAGYIANAEIREIINMAQTPDSGYTASTYHNHASNSDVLVYDDLEWVSFMTDVTKESRTSWYQSLNFGGVSDWAVDLDRDWGSSGIGDSVDEDDEGLFCDPEVHFDSLQALEAAAATVIPGCHIIYTLDVLGDMLDAAVARYNDVNNGYDSKFDSYVRYLKNALPYQLERWAHWRGPLEGNDLLGKGQQYFDCNFEGDGGRRWQGPCHVPQDVVGNRYMGIWSLQMTLRDSVGFDKALAELGIDREWVEFGEHKEEIKCTPTPGGTGVCVDFELTIQGYPRFKAEWEVPNPKDMINEAMPNIPNLEVELMSVGAEISLGAWEGSNSDVVEVLSMPILMMAQAIEGMAQAKEIGEDWQAEENKDLILTIITAVLFFVPAIGQVTAAAANLVRLARVFAAVGGVSGLGMTIVDIVENPEMAPLAIAGMMLGGRIKSPKEYGTAAGLRRGLDVNVKNGMGDVFTKHDRSLMDGIYFARRREA
ncbi:glycoside hydrolase family 18 protein [Parathielavia appendiculata]|uniref:chitinase n=1 Tax=Parathielavia appendiculata TaxID=2587402 RepID=A0AAN6YYQ5_9PEZI|nr:glycoside hydrolase family 18 protein [Parathielavia appendiculata]